MFNKALFASNHIAKEYIVVLKDESLRVFLDDSSLRSIGSKTNCFIELTNRILNRRVNSFKLIKYAIIKIMGSDESAIRQCNRLLEQQFPLYRHRKEYHKKSECCTLYSQEFIPDNSSLYFPFQRSGIATYQFGDVLVKSPYEPTLLRPNENCQWRMGDADLKKGITITQHRQVETYLSYQFKKSNVEQMPFDPKQPIRYIFDDFSEISYDRPRNSSRIKKLQIHKFDDYTIEKGKYIKSIKTKGEVYNDEDSINRSTCNLNTSIHVKEKSNIKRKSLSEKEKLFKSLEKIENSLQKEILNHCIEILIPIEGSSDLKIMENKDTEDVWQVQSSLDHLHVIDSDEQTNSIYQNIQESILERIIEDSYLKETNQMIDNKLNSEKNKNKTKDLKGNSTVEIISKEETDFDVDKYYSIIFSFVLDWLLKQSSEDIERIVEEMRNTKNRKSSKDLWENSTNDSISVKEMDFDFEKYNSIILSYATNWLINQHIEDILDNTLNFKETSINWDSSLTNRAVSKTAASTESQLMDLYFDKLLNGKNLYFESEQIEGNSIFQKSITDLVEIGIDDLYKEINDSFLNMLSSETSRTFLNSSVDLPVEQNILDFDNHYDNVSIDPTLKIDFTEELNKQIDESIRRSSIGSSNYIKVDGYENRKLDYDHDNKETYIEVALELDVIGFLINEALEKILTDATNLKSKLNANEYLDIVEFRYIDDSDIDQNIYPSIEFEIINDLISQEVKEVIISDKKESGRSSKGFSNIPESALETKDFLNVDNSVIDQKIYPSIELEIINDLISQEVKEKINCDKRESSRTSKGFLNNVESALETKDFLYIDDVDIEHDIKNGEDLKEIINNSEQKSNRRSKDFSNKKDSLLIQDFQLENKIDIKEELNVKEFNDNTVNEFFRSSIRSSSSEHLKSIDNCINQVFKRVQSEIINEECENTLNKNDNLFKKENNLENGNFIREIYEKILETITEESYQASFHHCENKKIENLYLLEPMKNPSARLIEFNSSIESPNFLKDKTLSPSTSSMNIKLPSHKDSSKKQIGRDSFFKKLDKRIINFENDTHKVGNNRIKEIIYRGSDLTPEELEKPAHTTSADEIHSNKFNRNANKIKSSEYTTPLQYESQNTLNIPSLKTLDGHETKKNKILFDTCVTINPNEKFQYIFPRNVDKDAGTNFQIINVDIDNDPSLESAEFGSFNAGCCKLKDFHSKHIIYPQSNDEFKEICGNLIIDQNLLENLIPNVNNETLYIGENLKKKDRIPEIVEIEDFQEISTDCKAIHAPFNLIHEVLLNTAEKNVCEESPQKALEMKFLVDLEFVNDNWEEPKAVTLSIENIFPMLCFNATLETTFINEIEIIFVNTKETFYFNLTILIETSGERNYLINQGNGTNAIIKYAEIIPSSFKTVESSITSNTYGKMQQRSTLTFYTTVSVENDLNDFIPDPKINDDPDTKTQLSTTGDVISSMTNDAGITKKEEESKCSKMFIPDREKIILVMKTNCDSPINVLRVKHEPNNLIYESPTNPTFPCTPKKNFINPCGNLIEAESSITEPSSAHTIKSILHNNCNIKKCTISNSKMLSFPDKQDYWRQTVIPQCISTDKSHFKQPLVKRTLLDLSKEVNSRRNQRQTPISEKRENIKGGYQNIKHTWNSFSNINDSNSDIFKDSGIEINDTFISSNLTQKVIKKTRARTLSDKIKLKAKQLILKLNPLKKNLDTETEGTLASVSPDDLTKTYIISDLSSKSSLDSKLSKNSLARYWNIHKFDSIKRMKVKGHLLPQTTWG